MTAVHLDGGLADRSAWSADRCSIGKAMDAIGNRVSMLLIREAFYGTTRFDDFATRVGVTQASAASRLRQLTDLGVLERRPYREAGQRTRHEYVLTEMGEDLLPTIFALMQWGDRWLQGEKGAPVRVSADDAGSGVEVVLRSASGRELKASDLRVGPGSRRRTD